MKASRGKSLLSAAAIAAATCLGGVVPARAAAGSPIIGSGDPGAIAGQFIVVLKGIAGSQVAGEAKTLVAKYGGTSGDVYTTALQGFALAATTAQATQMASDPAVSYVEQDETVKATGIQVLPPGSGTGPAPLWNLDRIDQRTNTPQNLYDYRNTAASVTAYVIDTGIRISHTDFQGRASYGFNAFTQGTGAGDCNGHGTHVAGSLGGATYGVAKSVKLVAVKVLDCNGDGTIATVLDGIDWVDNHAVKPAVVNLSLGFSVRIPAVDAAVTNSVAQGLTLAVAAGNDAVDASTTSPAGAPGPIVVGATDSQDTQASFSNFGSRLDLYAPGVDILSADWTSDTATATLSGTSMATPQVAGAAAMILQDDPSASPAQVKTALTGNATGGLQSSPLIKNLGSGSPDRLLYVPPPSVPVAINGPVASQQLVSGPKTFDFTFTGTAGQTVYVNGIGGSFNAAVTLYDPHGIDLASGSHNSFNSGNRESWISPVNLPLNGTYTIHIVPDAGATGSVSVQVLTYAAATATVNGAAVSATIPSALPGQRVAATFAGTAGETVYINGKGGSFNSSVSLYDPKGLLIASGSSFASDSGVATRWIAPTNLSAAGTYTLYITPDAGATGTVSFQVIGNDVAVNATVNGAAVSASITSTLPGRRVAATFAGTAGETVYIDGTGGSFNSSVSLYDPKGC